MSILDETAFIERLQFFNGQRLFASDLQGVEAFNREMRWLHNSSLHQPGIGNGFAAYGKKGDREVTIGPGYAIDARGREIVLTQTDIQQVPPVAGGAAGKPVLYDLTVSYPEDSDLEEAETREGVCLPRGVIRLREKPIFCWVRLDSNGQPIDGGLKQDVLTGMKIVLARAEVLNCQLNKDLSVAQRRSARPAKQPYITCGTVDPTDWEVWRIAEPTIFTIQPTAITQARLGAFILPCGLTTDIDTASAGFLTIPCYSARIEGQRLNLISSAEETHVIDGLVNIRNPTPKGFTIDVLLIAQLFQTVAEPRFTTLAAMTSAAEDEEEDFCAQILPFFSGWHVVWMGVEG
ncbi:MAG: hypothetical protein M5U01_28145 [Ardenticatenaceae bacterium]|nr:hypothetical protein [Ardenticatenaceae bacterium]HBY98943.1 hypothetical protein [Chloroflexota bacterium]